MAHANALRSKELRSKKLRSSAVVLAVAGILSTTGCPAPPDADDAGADTSPPGDAGPGGDADAGPDPVVDGGVELEPDPENPGAVIAVTGGSPAAPDGVDGGVLPWTDAPELGEVSFVPNLDSVILHLPAVAGAVDYRAFVLDEEVSLEVEGETERVLGATVHCAGYRQHNDAWDGTRELLRRLEVTGLSGEVRIVVEAIDTACPFPGVIAREHRDVDVVNYALPEEELITFPIVTADEVRASYGSLILNGHRASDDVAQPAPDVAPRVLARTTILLEPNPAAAPAPTSLVFDGFDDDADQPAFVEDLEGLGRSQRAKLFQNSDWSFYTYGAEHAEFSIDRGRLNTIVADWAQDIFATNVVYPKRPASLDDSEYLHAHFEVASNATQRRYWWFFLCGEEELGQTLDADGKLMGNIIQTSFFYQPDGRNPSVEAWNCLQVFARDGWPTPLAPTNTRPESDVRVMVNIAGEPEREGVVNVSPDQYECCGISPGWFRRMDGDGNLGAPVLDDHMLVAPNTRYDFWVRRDRVVMYVNGEQALCNDFPNVPLSMAEAAVGFGQVLYHSAAERVEFFRDYNLRDGQRYLIENTPYVDHRGWDNLGYDEGVAEPPDFDESACFVFDGSYTPGG
jgi:hypothetical protein